jgi:hypothetical protein
MLRVGGLFAASCRELQAGSLRSPEYLNLIARPRVEKALQTARGCFPLARRGARVFIWKINIYAWPEQRR